VVVLVVGRLPVESVALAVALVTWLMVIFVAFVPAAGTEMKMAAAARAQKNATPAKAVALSKLTVDLRALRTGSRSALKSWTVDPDPLTRGIPEMARTE
jgi:hypothetical protein